MTRLGICIIAMSLFSSPALGQWSAQSVATSASFRGLSVVDDRVMWASGTRGTVIHTEDGGATWRIDSIPGASAFDLRSIFAHDGRTAHVAATAGRIWRTRDGGATWEQTYQATDSAVFLDALAFRDARNGLALGDPLDGRFFLLSTSDGGASWSLLPAAERPATQTGEAAFAASGTSLVVRGRSTYIASGGSTSRVHASPRGAGQWSAVPSGLAGSATSMGVFSLAFADDRRGVAVGGDYTKPSDTTRVVALTTDGGRTWRGVRGRPPSGYRSGVAVMGNGGRRLIAVGTTGTDLSTNGGEDWVSIDTLTYNSVAFSRSGRSGWAVGPRGRVAKWGGK